MKALLATTAERAIRKVDVRRAVSHNGCSIAPQDSGSCNARGGEGWFRPPLAEG